MSSKTYRIHFDIYTVSFFLGGRDGFHFFKTTSNVSDLLRFSSSEVVAGSARPNPEAMLSGLCHQQLTPLFFICFELELGKKESVFLFVFFILIKKL